MRCKTIQEIFDKTGWVCLETKEEIVLVNESCTIHIKGDYTVATDRNGRILAQYRVGDFLRKYSNNVGV